MLRDALTAAKRISADYADIQAAVPVRSSLSRGSHPLSNQQD